MTTTRKQRELAREVIAALADLFPAAFFVFEQRRKPLKLGIDQDLAVAAADAITAEEIETALAYYTGNVGYLRCCVVGSARIGLDGETAGQVTADEAEHARELLATRRKRAARPATPKALTTAAPRDGLAALRAAWRRRIAS